MLLAVVRHAETIENATKHTSFCQDPRPWNSPAAHALSRDLVGLTPRGYRQCQWLRTALEDLAGRGLYAYSSQYRRALDTVELALPGRPDVTALLNTPGRSRACHGRSPADQSSAVQLSGWCDSGQA